MGKIRRGNHTFLTWKGDHSPRHVHVYKDGKLVAKVDLERGGVMEGQVDSRLRRIIAELKREGKL
jgi:hypothetical protein